MKIIFRLSSNAIPGQTRSARKNVQSRSRHRATPAKVCAKRLSLFLNTYFPILMTKVMARSFQLVPCGGSGIEEIKLAIQQLTMRSHTSNSTSTYSSLSGSEGSSEPASRRGGGSDVTDTASRRDAADLARRDGTDSTRRDTTDPAIRRLIRHSSLETINTNVTAAADEFVWVDSHNRCINTNFTISLYLLLNWWVYFFCRNFISFLLLILLCFLMNRINLQCGIIFYNLTPMVFILKKMFSCSIVNLLLFLLFIESSIYFLPT